jgi:hypothetical protein
MERGKEMKTWQVAQSVIEHKKNHPEKFCPFPKCLWRTENGKCCPNHTVTKVFEEQLKKILRIPTA